MMLHNLFPTPLGIFDIDRELTKSENDFIQKLERRNNMGNLTSVDNNVLDNPKIKNIRKFIEESLKEYFTNVYQPRNETSLRITQSWCNFTELGQYHHKHAHPNSFLSGVFYPQANKETDKIFFYREGYLQLKTPTDNYNEYNSDSWWMEAFTGRLYIFPSSLTHMVETIQNEGTRISLSFNTFPVGNFGHNESLTGLTL